MLPPGKYEGKEVYDQVLVQRKDAEAGLARLKKALKRKVLKVGIWMVGFRQSSGDVCVCVSVL